VKNLKNMFCNIHNVSVASFATGSVVV